MQFVIRESIQMAFQLFDSRKRLQDKEEQLNLAMDAENHGYWDWDLDTNKAYFSPKYCEMLGYEPDELPGDYRTWEKLLHPEDKEHALETVREKLKHGQAFELEFRMQTKSGNWKWIKGKGNLYYIDQNGVPHRFVGTHEDITERKQAEEKLKIREQNLHITLNSIGDAVIATDSRGNIIRMNPIAESLCGWSIEKAAGRPLEEVFRIVNAHTRQSFESPVKRVMETGSIVGLANHTLLISKTGEEYQIADSAAPIQGDTGEMHGVVLVFRDVTEEYRKNQQLKESKEFLDAVFMSIQDGISVLDTDLSIRYVNPVMEKWYASNLPLIGSRCYSAYHNRDTPCDPCPSLRCMKTGRTETDIVPVEADINSPVKWVELFSYPLVDAETGKIKE
ncbi:MAG: PAS domain S-box protein [Spirochaetia bacterium]|nr:PAS domain S-box protein [Spirochaetia bacterium]